MHTLMVIIIVTKFQLLYLPTEDDKRVQWLKYDYTRMSMQHVYHVIEAVQPVEGICCG